MLLPSGTTLAGLVFGAPAGRARFIADAQTSLPIDAGAGSRIVHAELERFRDRSVMIATKRQMQAALWAIALDGIARRMVLCPPELSSAQRTAIAATASIDDVLDDESCAPVAGPSHDRAVTTEWVLCTSGTTGPPKLAVHDLASLVAPFGVAPAPSLWSSFYDIRRYGGLQILLRALVGGGSMVLSEAGEPVGSFLARAAAAGVTRISGTPSHWRGVLMSAASSSLSPEVVRLSGEACDQSLLDRLQRQFPRARVGHAFASTEAGVGFEVSDGQAGFAASLIGEEHAEVQLRVVDGSLRIRSPRTARRYLGEGAPALSDAAGFVDTGDLVVLRGTRYGFVGREGGIINVGGHKVHPEAVEAVINQHPVVHASRVSARSSPITGALVVAEIVIRQEALAAGIPLEASLREILDHCRERLPPHQVPATLRQTQALEVAASGKLVRSHA